MKKWIKLILTGLMFLVVGGVVALVASVAIGELLAGYAGVFVSGILFVLLMMIVWLKIDNLMDRYEDDVIRSEDRSR